MKMSNGKAKFVFSEVFNNSDGKTSGSGFIGVMMGLVGCLAFVAAIVGYFMELPDTIPFMQQTIFFIGSATVLLGIRKFAGKGSNGNTDTHVDVEDDPDVEEKG